MILFGCTLLFLLLLAIAVPVAFSIGMASLVYFWFADVPLVVAAQQVLAGPDSWVLMALPTFVLAGMLMNSSGISARIVDFANAVVGSIRGGLAMSNILANMLFGGISGSATADAAALGTVIIPAMKKAGYRPDFAAALTSSASSIGIVIPPSTPMIIYGAIAEVSVGKMFLAGVIPGILMGLFLGVVVYCLALHNRWKPVAPFSWRNLARKSWAASLALIMPLIIIGGLLLGAYTPTEVGAVACVYGFVVSYLVYGSISLREVYKNLVDAAVLTSVVTITISFSLLMGWILSQQRVPEMITRWFLGFTDDPSLTLVLITVLMIVLGGPLDATPLLVVVVPILIPVVKALGVDLVHFGIVIIFTIVLSQQSPPVGNPLFVVAAISGQDIFTITRANIPFIIAATVLMYLILFFPEIVLFLPRLAPGG